MTFPRTSNVPMQFRETHSNGRDV